MGINGKFRISAVFWTGLNGMFLRCSTTFRLWISLLLTESLAFERRKLFEHGVEIM